MARGFEDLDQGRVLNGRSFGAGGGAPGSRSLRRSCSSGRCATRWPTGSTSSPPRRRRGRRSRATEGREPNPTLRARRGPRPRASPLRGAGATRRPARAGSGRPPSRLPGQLAAVDRQVGRRPATPASTSSKRAGPARRCGWRWSGRRGQAAPASGPPISRSAEPLRRPRDRRAGSGAQGLRRPGSRGRAAAPPPPPGCAGRGSRPARASPAARSRGPPRACRSSRPLIRWIRSIAAASSGSQASP